MNQLSFAYAWILAASLFLVSTSPAAAQEASVDDVAARQEFGAGREAYDRGAFAEALLHFERAHQLSPRPELLYNIGRAAESDGQWTRAISAYSSYLEAFPRSENEAFVEARLAKMRELELLSRNASAGAEPAQASTPPVRHEPVHIEPVHIEPVEHEPAAAESTTLLPAAMPPETRDDLRSKPVWKRAWFWSVVGVVVAGGATAAVLATRPDARDPAAANVHVLTLVGR